MRFPWEDAPHTNFPINDDDLAAWKHMFQVPKDEEPAGGPPDPPRDGYTDGKDWAIERWPSLRAWSTLSPCSSSCPYPNPLPTACDPNGLHRDNIVTPACRDVGEDGRRVTAQVWMSEVPVGEALFVRDPLLYQRVRALTRPRRFALTAGVGCVTGLSKQSRGKKAACRVTGHETPPPPKGAAALVEGIRRKQGRHFVQDLVSFPTIPTRHLTRVHLMAKVASFHSVVFPRGIAIEDAVGRGCC